MLRIKKYRSWEKFKLNSSIKRVIWTFVGGFVFIIGARMARGYTSGPILSGGMQIAVSILVFGAFTFVGLLAIEKFFFETPLNETIYSHKNMT